MTASLALSLALLLSSADAPSAAAVQQLSAKQFKAREAGQQHLAAAMPRVRLLVQFHAAASDCPETRRRCERILREYRPSLWERVKWWAEVCPERWPHMDMVDANRMYRLTNEPAILDMLGHPSRADLFNWYYARAQRREEIFGPDVVYSAYREATLWYVVDCESRGWPATDVRLMLDSMVPAEMGWYAGAGLVRP